MYLKTALLAFFSLTAVCSAQDKIQYPMTERGNVQDVYHGINVSDPYRWLEETGSGEARKWIDTQEQLFNGYVKNHPMSIRIKSRIERLDSTGAGYSAPQKRGGFYYFTVSDPTGKFNRFFRREGIAGKSHLVYDPNERLQKTWLPAGHSISPDGKYLALRITEGPRTWGDLVLIEASTSQVLPERLTGLMTPNIAWADDGSGFFYVSDGDAADLNSRNEPHHSMIMYHVIGTDPAQDILIHRDEHAQGWVYTLQSTTDSKGLIVSVYKGTGNTNEIYFRPFNTEHAKLTPIFRSNDFAYTFLASRSDTFWFYTNRDAPNGRIIRVRTGSLDHALEDVIPASEGIIAGGSTAGGNAMIAVQNRIVLLYRKGPISYIKIFTMEGEELHHVSLKTGWIGSGLVGSWEDTDVWYSLNTFTSPSSIYRLDVLTGSQELYFNRHLPIDADKYITRYDFFKSKDGTRVPIFLAYPKGTKFDGTNPIFMYAYGFGGWVATPWYQPQMLAWLDIGGIYVLPGIRGGGEYGEAWKHAGIHLNRQTAINDYIAAAEWLIKNKYTSKGLIVANGWSASGSLAAAAVIQRPELFGAGLIGIPSLDLLRYHLFTPFKGWTKGYGSSEDPEEFSVLYSYSPYHNMRAGTSYPPMLVTVGEEDPVTPPQHGYKFVARMQHLTDGLNPVLLKIVRGGGHGFGTTKQQTNQTRSDELIFLIKAMGLRPQD